VVSVVNGTLLNAEAATAHTLVAVATSTDGSTSSQSFTIAVQDIDEFDVSALADANAAANTVAENSAAGTVVGLTARASDADATTNAVNYAFTTAGNPGNLFAIDAASGVVTVAGALDFEAAPSRTVEIRATSADGSISTQSFTIAVSDVNENSGPVGAVADLNAAANTVAENAAAGTAVGVTARAVDPDATDTVTYSLSDNAGGRFAINATTGVVSVANGTLLNAEAAAAHNLTIVATSTDGSTTTQALAVAVQDVDEFDVSAVADTNNAANSVAENATTGTVFGITALASDADATASVSYALSDNAGGRFAINATTGVVTVADGTLLNAEAATAHTLVAVATSTDGSTSSQSFTIAVQDIDEFDVSALADANAAANTVAENSAAGTVVGLTARASDADATTNAVNYAFTTTGNPGNLFAIDASTGVITVAGALDFETSPSRTVEVRATSADGSSSTQSFTIAVSDVVEGGGNQPPVITSNGGGATATVSVREGVTAVTDADATDADIGQALTYSIAGGADAALFAIDPATGVLSFVTAPDFENPTDAGANNVYDVNVGVADGAGGSDMQAISVTVSDVAGRFVLGTFGRDVLVGTSESDVLIALGGDDNLNGQAGDDSLFGGSGDDRINGGEGRDELHGGAGQDRLNGGAGIDTVSYLLSGAGVNVNLRADTASGGDASGDRLNNIENLVGSFFNDTLTASDDVNDLSGLAGADVLRGLGGADRLTGGLGNDTFDFDALSDSTSGAGADLITDFERGADRIDLSTLDANTTLAGNQAFATLLQGRDTNFTQAGQLRTWYDAATNRTVVQGDTNGDGQADFEIVIGGDVPLNLTDFVL
jgi:hypothetical protein